MGRIWPLFLLAALALAACGEFAVAVEPGVAGSLAQAGNGATAAASASHTVTATVTPSATATAGAGARKSAGRTATASATASATATATASATPSPTATAAPPTRTPVRLTRTPSPPVVTPTASATPTPPAPVIERFTLTGNEKLDTGRRLSFAWAARGSSARLTGQTRPDGSPSWSLPLSGAHTVVLGETLYENPTFVLTVADESSEPARVVTATVSVAWPCAQPYFFAGGPALCAQEAPQEIEAAVQPFEGGRMVWLGHEDDILVFYDDDHSWQLFDNQWQGGETGGDEPPPGFYRPVRGFGLVWRNEAMVRQRLGWGLAAEQGYTARLQGQAPVGERSLHFLELADGAILGLAREKGAPAGWHFVRGSALACEEVTAEAPALSTQYAAALGNAALEGVAGEEANLFGRRCTDSAGEVSFTPSAVWFWVAITAPDLDYELLGRRLAAYLDLMAGSFRAGDLPAPAIIYGSLSTATTGPAGEPLDWIQSLSHPLADLLAARAAGHDGRALLEASGLLPAGEPLQPVSTR